MKEFIEKLVTKLEKDNRIGRKSFEAVIENINQLAEEYKDKDCSKCTRRTFYQQGYKDAERNFMNKRK